MSIICEHKEHLELSFISAGEETGKSILENRQFLIKLTILFPCDLAIPIWGYFTQERLKTDIRRRILHKHSQLRI